MKPEQLKRWRKKMGWTQADLAEHIGYERWAVMKWEQGVVRIPKWLQLIMACLENCNEETNKDARKAR